jgi:hypothetical protein
LPLRPSNSTKKLKLFIPGIQVPNMSSRSKMKIPSGYMKPYRLVPPAPKTMNKSWTEEEVKEVLNQIKNKRNPEDIAKKLNRPVSEVRSRLKVIAADMYLTNKIPYDEIHEQTGVAKDTLILTPSRLKNDALNESTDTEDGDHVIVNVSIYDFPEDIQEAEGTPMVNVDIKDTKNEMIITVSLDSPFSVKSICEHISTPIFSTCSRFAKNITGVEYETLFTNNTSQILH